MAVVRRGRASAILSLVFEDRFLVGAVEIERGIGGRLGAFFRGGVEVFDLILVVAGVEDGEGVVGVLGEEEGLGIGAGVLEGGGDGSGGCGGGDSVAGFEEAGGALEGVFGGGAEFGLEGADDVGLRGRSTDYL